MAVLALKGFTGRKSAETFSVLFLKRKQNLEIFKNSFQKVFLCGKLMTD